MPIVEKEVARPGTYHYVDQATGQPRQLVVTPELTRYWHEQGNAMLASGLTVPVPCEHDFDAHPMTPADKLVNNAGWVEKYYLKSFTDPKTKERVKDALFSSVDIKDESLAKKLPTTIRWTSPWINSFTDGKGKEWQNVISHLALTTRPRIVDQEPFGSVAAALSIATTDETPPKTGYCFSRAGRLVREMASKRVRPLYPVAFSLTTGIKLAATDMMPTKKKGGGKADLDGEGDDDLDMSGMDDMGGGDFDGEADGDMGGGGMGDNIDLPPLGDAAGDVSMTELLCDLLGALGVVCEHSEDKAQFQRNLYNAAMTEIHRLVGVGKAGGDPKNRANPPGMPPNNPMQKPNPLIQQEQQPMYMSLEDINKLPDPIRGVALAMHQENDRVRKDLAAALSVTNSLREAKLKEAGDKRDARIDLLSRFSPKIKEDLVAMRAMPAMALSMGDGGVVIDPMSATLAMLEKSLGSLPRLLTSESSALSLIQQPTDETEITEERANEIANSQAARMGCAPVQKAG